MTEPIDIAGRRGRATNRQEWIPMLYDHLATTMHIADLDCEIETIRLERILSAASRHDGFVERVRRRTGRILIAAGSALAGGDAAVLRSHRA